MGSFSPLHFDDIGDVAQHFIPPHPAPLLYLCRLMTIETVADCHQQHTYLTSVCVH